MGAMDHLLQKIVTDTLNSLGVTPDEIRKKVEEISGHVVAFRVQVDRIERQNAEIILMLQKLTGENHVTEGSGGSKGRLGTDHEIDSKRGTRAVDGNRG